jgi:hypothetical protein
VVFLTKCLGVPDGFGRAVGGGVASAIEDEAFFVGTELAGNYRVAGLVIGKLTVLQCAVEAADQLRFAGLAQERACACSHGAISYALVRVTRDEDHWNAVPLVWRNASSSMPLRPDSCTSEITHEPRRAPSHAAGQFAGGRARCQPFSVEYKGVVVVARLRQILCVSH